MLYIDASRYNNTEKRTGVENYSYFLINEIIKQNKEEITLIAPHKIDLPVPQITIPFPRLWTQLRLSWEILKNKTIDNLFIPSHLMPVIHPKNTTITIHDVAWKHVPKAYSWKSKIYLEWGTRFAVKHAKNIITPSQTTKDDLIKFYKADEKKIHVIPLGFESNDRFPMTDSQSIGHWSLDTGHYFLFIGRIETKKNVKTLIQAFEECQKKNPTIKLVLAGKPGAGGEKILKNLNNENIIVTGYISEEEKNALLKNALAFVFPSLYEGFGIPLLEAMDANIPIIASNIPTSRGIAGENALFFDPLDTDTLMNHMITLIEKTEIREELIKNHQKRLADFTWKKAAKRTLEILQNK